MTLCALKSLLGENDGPPVWAENPAGSAPFLLTCDHASNRIPQSLGTMGLDEAARRSHAAWDPGAYGVASQLAALLDAPLISARFSRLVFDVNRPASSPEAIRTASEIYDIPGNRNLDEAERDTRAQALYLPFHNEIEAAIHLRQQSGLPTALVTIHSFTPIYNSVTRSVELGILHDTDSRLADRMLIHAPEFTRLKAARNQPYGPEDGVTHTLVKHAIPLNLPNVMIEIRNDLIRTDAEQAEMARTLADLLRTAYADLHADTQTADTGGRDAQGH